MPDPSSGHRTRTLSHNSAIRAAPGADLARRSSSVNTSEPRNRPGSATPQGALVALSAERGTLGGVFLAGIIAVLLAGSSEPGPADGPR